MIELVKSPTSRISWAGSVPQTVGTTRVKMDFRVCRAGMVPMERRALLALQEGGSSRGMGRMGSRGSRVVEAGEAGEEAP